MKKVLIYISLCLSAFFAKAQSSAGVKADAGLTGLMISQSANLKSSMRAGGSAGFFYKYAYRDNLAVEADMMFRYRSSGIQNLTTNETADYRYITVELPVYFIHQGEIDRQSFYFGGGAFASYGLFSHYKSDVRRINPYKKDKTGSKPMMNRWDYGAAFIIGFETKCNLQINFNYQIGFNNLFDKSFEDIAMDAVLVGLGVGYRF
jgi:hypothetical protein